LLLGPRTLRKRFGVQPRGVLHVGAHQAEELEDYRREDFGPVIWVEAQPSLIPHLLKRVKGSDDLVLEGVAWSRTGETLTFNVASNGQSSSVFEMDEHLIHYPKIHNVAQIEVQTVRLDELVPDNADFDFVNLDVQGAELDALQGLSARLHHVRWIYAEVNRENLYHGMPLVAELDTFLRAKGFYRAATAWTGAGWGDALYVAPRNRGELTSMKIRRAIWDADQVFLPTFVRGRKAVKVFLDLIYIRTGRKIIEWFRSSR
jgi:FkbM family methyltransferase